MSGLPWSLELFSEPFLAGAQRFFNWYKREFFSFFPPDIARRLTDCGERVLILKDTKCGPEYIDQRIEKAGSSTTDEIVVSSVDEDVSRDGRTLNTVRIGLEMDADAFLVRQFDIPSIALGSLPKLVVSHIERKTPFSLDDVIYGYTSRRNIDSTQKTHIDLWLLRRDLAKDAAARVGHELSSISFIQPTGRLDPGNDIPLLELKAPNKGSFALRRIIMALCSLTLAFTVLGVCATLWRQTALTEEIDSRIRGMTARASGVRKVIETNSERIRLLSVLREARHNQARFTDLWDEVARLLPDDAFLVDMRLTETRQGARLLEIVGFANAAASLPALFNVSPFFTETSLTAPIAPDPQENRESFSLQARIEHPVPVSVDETAP